MSHSQRAVGTSARPRPGRSPLAEALDIPPIRIPVSAATPKGFRAWAGSEDYPKHVRISYGGGEIRIRINPNVAEIRLPAGAVATLEGFCDWATSGAFPRRGRFSFLGEEVFIDMSPEEIETHIKLKGEIQRVIGTLTEALDLGEFFPDGALVRNEAASLSNEPDGTLVKWETSESGRVRFVPRQDELGMYMQLEGTPDWVLEVVSKWSVQKDYRVLRQRYHRAGIPEYWLVDARGEEIVFQILTWRRNGYVAVRPRDGWYKSRVFPASFRLERQRNRVGRWKYELRVKQA
ncbi:MAG TPA: Uma2 family endonuclease [Gemmataceae bacterium]|nr:Uma2 family endonuclease [Gemmataceae bacterium]